MTELISKLFSEDQEVEEVVIDQNDPMASLVGEGKKYKDASALALAVVEKEKHIQNIQSENARMREALSNNQTDAKIDQLLEVLKQKPAVTQVTTPDVNQNPLSVNQNTPGLTIKDVEEALKNRDAAAREASNVSVSKQRLHEAYGDDWESAVSKAAKALNEDVSFINSIAKRNPDALLKIVSSAVQPTQKIQNPNLLNGTVQPKIDNSGAKNKAYFDSVLKQDPKLYWSIPFQMELHKTAKETGPSFFQNN